MPVTAALLKKLQETLGEEAASDLVTWVDQSTVLGLAQIRGDVRGLETRFERLEHRFERVEQRIDVLAEAHSALRVEFGREIARLDARLEAGLSALRVELASQRSDLIKWMFIFWAGTIIPLAGLMVALVKL